MEKLDFKRIFDKFSTYRVLIIGDVMIDSYILGKVKRISPEAPVPVVSDLQRDMRLGGAANVALNIQAMGAEPLLVSVIGDDVRGADFIGLLNKAGMRADGIVVDCHRQTSVKTRIICDNHHLLRVDDEVTYDISTEIEEKIVSFASELIEKKNVDAVIFEDYDKGLITPGLIKCVVEASRKAAIPVLVDPKKKNFLNYKGVSLFKPNFKEFVEGLTLDIAKDDFAEMHLLANQFQKKYGIRYVLLTLAELGMFICDEKEYNHVPALEKLDVADVSGAGDTVISVATLCLIAGIPPKELAFIANMAGGQVCEKAGVVPVNKEQLLKSISNQK